MKGTSQKVVINEANIKNNHFYLKSCIDFFPAASIGGANIEMKAKEEIRISLPFGDGISTDIAGDKGIFRKRAWIGQLYKYRDAKPGDEITMTWLGSSHLKIDLEKKTIAAEFKAGETIQLMIATEAWLTRSKFEIPEMFKSFFPNDALGARGLPEQDIFPPQGKAVEFDYGIAKSICDIATRKNGVMRPRESKGTREFYEANRASVGDLICLTRISERQYKVSFVKQAK